MTGHLTAKVLMAVLSSISKQNNPQLGAYWPMVSRNPSLNFGLSKFETVLFVLACGNKNPQSADTSVLYLLTVNHEKFPGKSLISYPQRMLGHAFAHRCQQKNGSYT
jgi:hypothetical protein